MKSITLGRIAICALAVVFIVNFQGLGQQKVAPNPPGGGGGGGTGNTIAHDTSMTGAGTNTSPLGVATGGINTGHIADGSVTSGKLAATNAPQTGQVLTFNGTAMNWQTPAASNAPAALRVVDSQGSEVGFQPISGGVTYTTGDLFVLRYFPGAGFISFYITVGGVYDYEIPYLYYESTDCTGTGILPLNYFPDRFAQEGYRYGSSFYYSTAATQSYHIRSLKPGNDPCQAHEFTGDLPVYVTIPVTDLGTPPFRLAR